MHGIRSYSETYKHHNHSFTSFEFVNGSFLEIDEAKGTNYCSPCPFLKRQRKIRVSLIQV